MWRYFHIRLLLQVASGFSGLAREHFAKTFRKKCRRRICTRRLHNGRHLPTDEKNQSLLAVLAVSVLIVVSAVLVVLLVLVVVLVLAVPVLVVVLVILIHCKSPLSEI